MTLSPFPMPPTAHILVVDDEPEIAEPLADFLSKKEGYTITLANNGRQAIEFLQSTLGTQTEIDLVLLDMRMPEMSGLEVLEWIRSHSDLTYTRVVLLTAAAGSMEKVEALSAGADDYITKPYYPQELLARVKTILRTQQLEKQLQRQSQQLAMLNRVGQMVAISLETQEVISVATTGLHTVLGVEIAAAFMVEGGQLHCQRLYPAEVWQAEQYGRIPPGVGIIGTTLVEQTAVYHNAPHTVPHYNPQTDIPPGFPLQAIIAAPISVRGKPVGLLVGLNKTFGPFSETDRELISSLATSISEAIENAWLFQRIRLRQLELLESRNTLQALIDGILHPIYTINDKWQVVTVNKNKADELETTPAALLNNADDTTCYRVFFNRQTPCEHCLVAQTLRYKTSQGWSVRWADADHLPREWDVNAYPIPGGAKANAPRAVVVWLDRTEERRLENSLVQAGKLAAIGQLAAGVAHEINNPLTVINANAQILQMLMPKNDDNYESVDLIARAGDRAAKVVRGLLDFARQEQYNFTPANINDSIRQALGLVRYQLQTANIQVLENLAEGLPTAVGSWEHLASVWVNLIVNARDAVQNNSGERLVEITTRLGADQKHIQVLVRDNGKGMTPAELKHIFEPFYTTKAPGKGTGLGLATTHRIIEQHYGEIQVVSAPREGTTFIIRLPLERAANGKPTT